MQKLRQHGGTSLFLVEPKNITTSEAGTILSVEYQAYKNRFPELTQSDVETYFRVAKKDVPHLLDHLKRFSGYVILAQREKRTVGYGLFELRKNSIFIAEVHADPRYAQNIRVGTATLLVGLDHAQKPHRKRIAETWVGRRSLQDPFPYNWFVRMGFSKTSTDIEQVPLGQLIIQRYPMEAELSRVVPYLEQRLMRFKG